MVMFHSKCPPSLMFHSHLSVLLYPHLMLIKCQSPPSVMSNLYHSQPLRFHLNFFRNLCMVSKCMQMNLSQMILVSGSQ